MSQSLEGRQGNLYRLSRIVPAGFGAILLLMVGIGVATRFSVARLVETVSWVSHTNEVKADINQLEKIVVNAETGQRGFLYTGKENFLEPYLGSLKIYQQELDQLRRLVADNPEQVRRLEELEVLIQRKFNDLAETIALKRAGKEKELRTHVLSGQGKQAMDNIRE
ncbi:MAG: CHASE3 domain-containing protein, partial [Leptolyngbyaceae cyanobacterium bins.59]|nr:CHASE3 domain-containing protein [Leptolyngbyaceae cyanobacterium bins.59]